ncbi:zonular occludens toxin domain-containing protein [Agaribacterium sp. ZY112]|uniref:zonular occludens toxin domain-containing protein n=1 Tax=Agaribacterium sp. ZY112 TaxID=3233574 RepID=UPI0035255CB5
MTISAYTGLPGHGKTYGVVEHVIAPALEASRVVFTNIPMIDEECQSRFGMTVKQFRIEDIVENPNWWEDVFIAGSVIIIDELWRLWPSGLNAKNVRQEDKSFLAEHRHMVGENGYSTEIVLVTQDLGQIANFARSLVETTYRTIKQSKLGFSSRYRVDVYYGPVTGASPPVSKREREIHGSFKKEIFQLYQSHTKSKSGEAGNESRIDNRFSVLGRLSIKIGFALAILSLTALYYGVQHLIGHYSSPPTKYAVTPSLPIQPQVTPPSDQSQISTKPQVREKRKKENRFLSDADSVFITGRFSTRYPNGKTKIEYIFEINFTNSIVHLNQEELTFLGYEFEIVNDCMVKLGGQDYQGYALCRTHEEPKGFIEGLVSADPA